MSSRRGGFVRSRLPSSRADVLFAGSVTTVVLLLGLMTFALSYGPFTAMTKEMVSDVVTDLLAVCIPISCGRAAVRASGRNRTAWVLMTAAGACWALGELSWLYEEYVASVPRVPPLSDIFFLLALLPAAGALVAFPVRRLKGNERIRALLGSMMVGASLLFISKALALSVILPSESGTTAIRTLYMTFPVADIILASFALNLLIRSSLRLHLHLVLVALGFLYYAVGDTAYLRATSLGWYAPGSLLDVVWAAGYAVFVLAALAPQASRNLSTAVEREPHDRRVGLSSLVIYLPLLGAVVVATARPSPVNDPVLIISGISMLILFGIRQALLAIDNSRLRHDLQRQVGRLEERGVELRQLAHQNEGVLQSVVDGVLGVEAGGQITFVNAQASAMLGRPAQDIVGADERTLFADLDESRPQGVPGDEPMPISAVGTALVTGTAVRNDRARFRRGDQSVFPVELAVGPVREGDRITGAVVVFRDVSARLAVEKMKNEFISVVSHELRTPLTSIRGSLGLLASGLGGELTSPGARMVKIALDSSERLTRLIEDMLDIERMESGTLAMTVVDCQVADLVRTALNGIDVMATVYGVTVTSTDVSGVARGDPDRIVQVLTNLLGNAIKFSDRGGLVTVSSRSHDQMIEVAVRDRGRGVPPDKAAAIFERFEQVDSSDSRERGGSGLGLTISRDIVRLHGGRIWVESLPGEGATFYFTLPSASGLLAEAHHAADSGDAGRARGYSRSTPAPAEP